MRLAVLAAAFVLLASACPGKPLDLSVPNGTLPMNLGYGTRMPCRSAYVVDGILYIDRGAYVFGPGVLNSWESDQPLQNRVPYPGWWMLDYESGAADRAAVWNVDVACDEPRSSAVLLVALSVLIVRWRRTWWLVESVRS